MRHEPIHFSSIFVGGRRRQGSVWGTRVTLPETAEALPRSSGDCKNFENFQTNTFEHIRIRSEFVGDFGVHFGADFGLDFGTTLASRFLFLRGGICERGDLGSSPSFRRGVSGGIPPGA